MDKERPWRRIGWDGIALQVPADWHTAAVYTDYLLFEDRYQPVFGLKWQRIRGRFEAKRILKKLQKSLGQSELTAWQPPPEWHNRLKSFIHQGFQWNGGGDDGGTGLLLYCRESRRALLLQFYKNGSTSIFRRLLAGLQTWQSDKKQLWSLFDISILLPKEAQLAEHEFLPGSFRLHFQLPERTLTFYRFKPAAELLRKQSLRVFGSQIADGAPLKEETSLLVQWQRNSGTGRRLLSRLRKQPACSTVRFWQIPEKNVIFALKVQGIQQVPAPLFEDLCHGYTPC